MAFTRAERSRRYRERHPERALEQSRRNHEKFRERDNERLRQWRKENPDKAREQYRRAAIKHQYGLTVAEYESIVAQSCAICGTQEGQRCLDHDHSASAIRDALCAHCNRGLGDFQDDPGRLRTAADYLEKHNDDLSR